MADQDGSQAQRMVAATFPGPPPFFLDFTPERIARYEEIRASQHLDNFSSASLERIPNLPSDLVNLQPPAEPENGEWRCFGDRFTVRLSRRCNIGQVLIRPLFTTD